MRSHYPDQEHHPDQEHRRSSGAGPSQHRRAPIPYDLPGRKGGPPRDGPVAAVRALRPHPSIPPSYAVESLVWHRRSTSSFGFHLLETPVSRLHRSEEHTSELQSRGHLVCRPLLENKTSELAA